MEAILFNTAEITSCILRRCSSDNIAIENPCTHKDRMENKDFETIKVCLFKHVFKILFWNYMSNKERDK